MPTGAKGSLSLPVLAHPCCGGVASGTCPELFLNAYLAVFCPGFQKMLGTSLFFVAVELLSAR